MTACLIENILETVNAQSSECFRVAVFCNRFLWKTIKQKISIITGLGVGGEDHMFFKTPAGICFRIQRVDGETRSFDADFIAVFQDMASDDELFRNMILPFFVEGKICVVVEFGNVCPLDTWILHNKENLQN